MTLETSYLTLLSDRGLQLLIVSHARRGFLGAGFCLFYP